MPSIQLDIRALSSRYAGLFVLPAEFISRWSIVRFSMQVSAASIVLA